MTKLPSRYSDTNRPTIQSRATPLATAALPAEQHRGEEEEEEDNASSSSDTASSGTEAPPALQVASFISGELSSELKSELKRYRDYFHDDHDVHAFVEAAQAKHLRSWAPVAHWLLDIGSQDPRKFSTDAELLCSAGPKQPTIITAKQLEIIPVQANEVRCSTPAQALKQSIKSESSLHLRLFKYFSFRSFWNSWTVLMLSFLA